MSILEDFKNLYQRLYGHWIENREIELESIKIIGSNTLHKEDYTIVKGEAYSPNPADHISSWQGQEWLHIPSYKRESLKPGAFVSGPAIVGSNTGTPLFL